MQTLLISHFFNEEFLMPLWVKHHIGMFDHVVMIDYASTDRSVEIIRELAPHWEVRPSRNALFDAPLVDQEVMDIESKFQGYWKVALNSTEFLLMPNLNLKATLHHLKDVYPHSMGVACRGVRLIDKVEDSETPMDMNQSLFCQRHWGIIEDPQFGRCSRCRMIHCHSHGRYQIGRHMSYHAPVETLPDQLYCVWAGWSPYVHLRPRKMQVQTRIPKGHMEAGWGVEHNMHSIAELDGWFRNWSGHASDLFLDAAYKGVVDSFCSS